MHDEEGYVIDIKNLKQALKHGLVLKKVHSVIKFNQKAWLKPYNDMNTKLRRKAKYDSEKDLLKLMNNLFFDKVMENMRKYRDIKLVITEKRKNYFVSEPLYRTTKFLTGNILPIAMEKYQILLNKPVYF